MGSRTLPLSRARKREQRLGRPRARSLTRLFPRPPTAPCGTVSVLHGSPGGTIHRFRTTGLPPPSPAIVLHLWPCALWLAVPASDYYAHSVPLGLAPRRPSRSAHPPHVAACGRRSPPAFPALLGRCWPRSARSGRPLAGATRPPGSETLSPEALHGPMGLGLQAVELSPGHAGLAEPRCQRLLPCSAFSAGSGPLALSGPGAPLPLGSPRHPTHLRWGCCLYYCGAPDAGGNRLHAFVQVSR